MAADRHREKMEEVRRKGDTNLEVLASRLVGMTKAVVLGTHGA